MPHRLVSVISSGPTRPTFRHRPGMYHGLCQRDRLRAPRTAGLRRRMMTVKIEFCGEDYRGRPGSSFTIGREADLVIDENPFLHRRFLRIRHEFDVVDSQRWKPVVRDGVRSRGNTAGMAGARATLPIVFEKVRCGSRPVRRPTSSRSC